MNADKTNTTLKNEDIIYDLIKTYNQQMYNIFYVLKVEHIAPNG